MRNGSDDDLPRTTAFGPGPSAGVPSIGVPDDNDEPFALGEFVAALRRPADLGPSVDTTVMDAIRLAPAPLVVVAGASPRRAAGERRGERRAARTTAGRRRAADPSTTPLHLATSAPLPRAWQWFTRPRAVRVTPLGALAAAGVAIAAVVGLRREPRLDGELAGNPADQTSATGEFAAVRHDSPALAASSPASSTPAAAARDTVFITRFMLVAPGAKQVALVGDFNDWDRGATPLARVVSHGSGTSTVWKIDLPLTAGRHSYAFLIDGQRWVADPDPARPRAIGDDFGRPNSAVTVGGGAA